MRNAPAVPVVVLVGALLSLVASGCGVGASGSPVDRIRVITQIARSLIGLSRREGAWVVS